MQVSVEKLEGLERRLNVQIPAERIDQEVQVRLRDLVSKVRVHGFRPGKVPFKMVKRMYGAQVRQEVLGEVLQESLTDALKQEDLRLANSPNVEPKNMKEGENLEYSAVFEVLPEFELQAVEGLQIDRPVAEVTEADIDKMLENLRRQRTVWHDVERPAADGDRITIDFEGSIDGEVFAGGKGEKMPVVLGSGAMLPDFEMQLRGLQAGSEIEFDMTFPENYQAQNLAGKTAHFKVKAHSVAEPELPVVDEEFAKSFDLEEGGVDALRAALQENMEHQLADKVKNIVHQRILERLFEAHEISVPQSMVKSEIDTLAEQAKFTVGEGQDEDAAKQEAFGAEAQRRVALGLIISRLIAENDMQVDEARVYEQLEALAGNYEGVDSEQIIQIYRQNQQIMEMVRSRALQEQVADWLLERAQVNDITSSFDDIMNPERTEQPA